MFVNGILDEVLFARLNFPYSRKVTFQSLNWPLTPPPPPLLAPSGSDTAEDRHLSVCAAAATEEVEEQKRPLLLAELRTRFNRN